MKAPTMLLIIGFVFAILLFMKGFLLTKKVNYNRSECGSIGWCKMNKNEIKIEKNKVQKQQQQEQEQEKSSPRVFLFIVDALRYDFFLQSEKDMMNYGVNFPHLRRLMKDDTGHVLLYRQRSEPPTTTSQRLSAMTSGSIPTFIDFSSNFNRGGNLVVDNWIDQYRTMKANNSKIIFTGDDTWESLFPGKFDVSLPFDSFNTMDLDTVDDGVEKVIDKLLFSRNKETSWEIFIAHFLGVDHIGHTYSTRHPLMQERLLHMDHLALKVIRHLKKESDATERESIFVLMGDHGMTDDGNHGGGTMEETDSIFYIYSTRGGFKEIEEPRLVRQLDIVPSLSLLLGLPIPYSNLGKVIPELFVGKGELDQALKWNVLQVSKYLSSFQHKLDPPVNENDYSHYLDRVMEWARQEWTAFHTGYMIVAILLAGVCLSMLILNLFNSNNISNKNRSINVYNITLSLVCVLHSLGATSNSFVEQESEMVLFYLQTSGIAMMMEFVSTLNQRNTKVTKRYGREIVVLSLVSLVCNRLLWGLRGVWKDPATEFASMEIPIPSLSLLLAIGTGAWIFVASYLFLIDTLSSTNDVGLLSMKWVSFLCFVVAQIYIVAMFCWTKHTSSASHWVAAFGMTVIALSLVGLAASYVISLDHPKSKWHTILHLITLLVATTGPASILQAMLFIISGCCISRLYDILDTSGKVYLLGCHLSLLSRFFFFTTGHAFRFNALQLSAGFLGCRTFHFYWAGTMLAFNTSAADILGMLIARLQNGDRYHHHLHHLSFFLHRGGLVLGAMIATLVLRRHLMIWDIFAPKFILEVMLFFIQSMFYIVLT